MAARRLTPDQQRIVTTLDRPLFVAAGAGSGKSSTLAERVAWALDEASGEGGVPFVQSLDQVLVITFTNAAAEEIKEKIRARLREGGMEAHALAVDSAWISTIHGMCSRILRRHAFDLGIDPAFKVLDEASAAQLVERAVDEVLREVTSAGRFPELFAAFHARLQHGGDADSTVFGMVRAIRDAAGSALDGFDSVSFPGVMPDAEGALKKLYEESERALIIGRSEKAFGSATGSAEEEQLENNLGVLADYFACAPNQRVAAMGETMAMVLAPKKQAYHKASMKEVGADLRAAYAGALLAVSFAQVGPLAADVLQLAWMVDERYRAYKDELGALDNDGLLSRTFAAFNTHPELAHLYGSKFRLVMVDEFQDTNAQQVKMIELLSGKDACHLTTVGDAQQSIYRFRAADVQVFRDREAASNEETYVRLTMNFRSHDDILKFVERALSNGPLPDFMPLQSCPTRTDGLRARTLPRVDVEVVSSKTRGANAETRANALSQLIADRIKERIECGERPEDVALLLGRMTNLDAYLTALRSRGVDCVVSGGSTFSSAPEVHLVAALLHVLANPKDTQAGLFPVLVSELFSLDADDFCMLATKVQEQNGAYAKRAIEIGLLGLELPDGFTPSVRLQAAHDTLLRAIERARTWKMADVLKAVFVESGWIARTTKEGPDGQARVANVLAAIRYVESLMDEGGLGPARAAVEFDQWLALSKIGPASLSGDAGGAVKIMTVHASKGLEYPVVAVADCWGSSRARSVKGITCENQHGEVRATLVPQEIGAKELLDEIPDHVDGKSDLVDWARWLTHASAEGDHQERARLLYVALTRAKESVILGMNVQVSAKGELSPRLASEVVETLFGGELPQAGLSLLDYGGSQAARVRHAALSMSDAGELVVDPDELAACLAVEDEVSDEPTLQLYAVDPEDVVVAPSDYTYAASPRAGVFSYSSAHALMRAAVGGGSRVGACEEEATVAGETLAADEAAAEPAELADTLVADAVAFVDEDIDTPDETADADKATNLGSAFHELAQTMVETDADYDPARIQALSTYWHLSAQQERRLREALDRWQHSDVRREARSYQLLRPEVPFFLEVASQYGSYVEGAIDLLGTNPGYDEAFVLDYKTGDADLSVEQVRARHKMQANFYAYVMRAQGYRRVVCVFVCVERDRGDGQPLSVRYEFDDAHLPQV